MAFSGGNNSSGDRGRIAQSSLAEINVTPLVDVMLVLLVIFMVASAVETARISREAETLRQTVSEEIAAATETDENQVPVDLPKAKADKVVKIGGKNQTPLLSMDGERRLYLDRDELADCRKKPSIDACLDAFEAALQTHPRGQGLRTVHLRADRRLDYGLVLALMARMRRVGIEHFGLITEEPPAAAPQK
jgi:biopolymer transport protein TolR